MCVCAEFVDQQISVQVVLGGAITVAAVAQAQSERLEAVLLRQSRETLSVWLVAAASQPSARPNLMRRR
jgi:hypothetical protein